MDDTITQAIRTLIREELAAEKPRLLPQLEPVPPLQLYSVKSAAQLLDRSNDYVLDRIKNGTFTRIVDLGRTRPAYRIRADDLQQFIEERTSLAKPSLSA